jgi:hypothetical protein
MAVRAYLLIAHRPHRQRPGFRLATEVTAWEAARDEQRATIRGQFTVDDARPKLRRLHPP